MLLIDLQPQSSLPTGSVKITCYIHSDRFSAHGYLLDGSQRNSSSSGGSWGSYRASFRDRCPEVEYSDDFFGNSRYAATGLYYDISGERRPVPSLEVESDEAWRIRGQFCDIVFSSPAEFGAKFRSNLMGCYEARNKHVQQQALQLVAGQLKLGPTTFDALALFLCIL